MTKSSADASELGYGRSTILQKKLYLRGYVGAPPASIQLSKRTISGYGDGGRVECGHFPAVQVGVKKHLNGRAFTVYNNVLIIYSL